MNRLQSIILLLSTPCIPTFTKSLFLPILINNLHFFHSFLRILHNLPNLIWTLVLNMRFTWLRAIWYRVVEYLMRWTERIVWSSVRLVGRIERIIEGGVVGLVIVGLDGVVWLVAVRDIEWEVWLIVRWGWHLLPSVLLYIIVMLHIIVVLHIVVVKLYITVLIIISILRIVHIHKITLITTITITLAPMIPYPNFNPNRIITDSSQNPPYPFPINLNQKLPFPQLPYLILKLPYHPIIILS